MLWLSFSVIITLRLFASVTVLTSFEVVVLALGAFPTAIREPEVRCHSLLVQLLRLPCLLRIHWHKNGSLVILSLKVVDFLGKLIESGDKRSSLLIELQLSICILSG